MRNTLLLFVALVAVAVGCRKDPSLPCPADESGPTLVLPDTPYDYEVVVPAHIQTNAQLSAYEDLTLPNFNVATNEGATLGRVLFYDRKLSRDNSISCSSCHLQEHAFSDPAQFSTGIDGHQTPRNSMPLLNLRYVGELFWDMRTGSLEQQVLLPIADPGEMDSDIDELVEELAGVDYYPALFEAAFGDEEITAQRISYAISQFVRAIVSFDAKFDQGVANDFADFTPLEADGMDLFYSGVIRCNQCHTGYNFFTRFDPAMSGLEAIPQDSGHYLATNNPMDIGAFKIVSLRNVEVTGPYMHDGRFTTLEEVVEQYNSGLHAHPNLDSRLTVEEQQGGTPLVMNMTDYEKESLVAFLKTLTDHTVMNDIRFSDPFHY